MPIKRILVTGGAGFIGKHLCISLIDSGHKVICLDNLITSEKSKFSEKLDSKSDIFKFINHDITQRIEIEDEIDEIFHLASPASPIDYLKLPIETLKVGAEMIGNRIRAKIVKNKVAPPFREAEFDIMFGKGISREGSLLDVGVEHGIVRKGGAWFTYDEVQLGQGKENSKNYLRENPDLALQLENDVYKAVGMVDTEDTISEDKAEDDSKEKKETNKKK